MSDITLPLPPEPNRRKLIFVGIIMLVLFVIVGAFVYISQSSGGEGGDGFNPKTKEVVIWTVGMEPAIFESLTKGFNEYVGRSDMKLRVQNFASYDDYLDILPRAVQAKVSPDVLVVPNHGGHILLDPYIVAMGENMIDFDDFETRYHPLFVDELMFEEKQKVDGANKLIRGLRGIPVGFEPLGIYYNRDMLTGVPAFWEEIPKQLVEVPGEAETKPIPKPALSLGYGRATPHSADIIALLTLQYEGEEYNSYASLDTVESRSTIEKYLDYRREPNNLRQYEEDFADTLTAADLFARGKVATLVGYPSTALEIDVAQKRAKKDKELDGDFNKLIRWTTIPQVDNDPKKQINSARYMYFALSKYGVNRNSQKPSNDPVIKFMQFLNTASAQETFFKNHEYYLPSQIALLKSEADTRIDPTTGPGMTVGDWYSVIQKFIPYDMGIPHEFLYISQKALDEPGATSSVISGNMLSYLACKLNHLKDPDTYERSCECRSDVEKNNNNYWPMCSWGI